MSTATPLTVEQRELLARMSAPPGEREGLFPVTAAQRGLWLLDQLQPGGTAYHMPALLWLRGPLAPDRFAAAVQRVVDRHESLRTTFVSVGGTPLQRVRARCRAEVSVVEAAGQEPDELVRAAVDAARLPFDLDAGPLLRVTLWRRTPHEHLALLVVHHIVCDGWSVGLLLADLAAAMDGVEPAPARGVEPVDVALREAAVADDDQTVRTWAAELADAAPSGLPWRPGAPGCGTGSAAVPGAVLRTVGEFARTARTTRHAVELAAVAVVLARYTGRTDVVLGMPVSSRSGHTQHTVGLLVSGLPVRVSWPGDPTFAELTAVAGDAVRLAAARGTVPPDRLLDHVSRLRPDARPALFDVMVSAEPALLNGDDLAGLAVEQVPVPPFAAKFPLTVGLRAAQVSCEFDTALLSEDFATGFASALARVLAAGAAAPGTPVSELPILDALGARRRLAAGRGPATRSGVGLGDRVRAIAERTPGRVAITAGSDTIGYGELVARAGSLAAEVARQPDLGTRPVAVCLPPGADLAVACVGVVLAGGHHVTLDPGRVEQAWQAIAALDPVALVTTAELADTLGIAGLTMIPVHGPPAGPPVAVAATPRSLAAIVPGVGGWTTVTHAALAAVDAREDETVLLPGSPADPATVVELWRALSSGGHCVVPASELTECLDQQRISRVAVDARTFRAVVAARPGLLDAVDDVVVDGGVAGDLRRGVAARIRYGVGEIGAQAAVGGDGLGAVPGGALHVLDDRLRPVPPGARGELHIAGAPVPAGLAEAPGATAGHMVSQAHGAWWWRTGHRAIGWGDGTVTLVDPAAERLLLDREDVADAVVLGGIGYVVAGPGYQPDTADLRAVLATRLPAADVPDAVVLVPAIPDDLALLRPPDRDEDRVAPRGERERLIAAVWAAVIGIDATAIARTDTFFALGGHSLLATRVAARLADALGHAVAAQMIFDHPTVARLAEALACLGPTDAGPPIRPVADDAAIPLSFAQQRLWFLQQYDPGNPVFALPLAVELSGPLDPDRLAGALGAVVRRHEPLRSTVDADHEVPRIRVHADVDVPLTVVDLSAGPVDAVDAVDAVVRAITLRPFDLAAEFPFRAALVRTAAHEHVLLVVVHHIACDGWSTAILARDITDAYIQGSALPRSQVRYRDYAAWQHEVVTSGRLDDELAHWCRVLDGAPAALDLPDDRPRPSVFRYAGATRSCAMTPGAVSALRRTAAARDLTPFMVLMTALALVLRRSAGQDDLVIGAPAADRSRPEVGDLVGCFLDVLPIRVDLSGDPTVGEVFDRVRGACVAAYAHQRVPFEQVVRRLRPVRDLSRTPVFQVLLALEPGPRPVPALPGVTARPYPVDTGATQNDLTFWFRADAASLDGQVVFNREVFDDTTVRRLVSRLDHVLCVLAEADVDLGLSDVDVVPPAEREWLTQVGRGPAAAVPPGSVAEAVLGAGRGDAVAIVDGSDPTRTLTYHQVGEVAHRVAAVLHERGVRHGDVVGVLIDRSPLVAPVLLGAWLAGAAYLPLDPGFPDARLAYMCADAGVRTVLAGSVTRSLPDVDLVPVTAVPKTTAPVLPTVGGADRAYVMYTSGSTGRPKGVLVRHDAVVNLLRALTGKWRLTPLDRVVAVTTISFDISVAELFAPLLAGARVVVADAEQAADPALLADLVDRCGATVVQATATTWRMLTDGGWRPRPGLRAWCGGEPLPEDLAQRLHTAGVAVGNQYGPTETTIWSTVDDEVRPGRIGLGLPIANTEVHVLDRRGEPLPAGAIGELCIGGVGVADGYHARPGLTAARFTPAGDGARLYRTGDLGRFGHDGALRFVGRADTQLKVRGHRVEPGELETCLAEHPTVHAAVAVARADRLIAYVTGTDPEPDALRAWLRERLPEYLVPSTVVVLDAFPRTPNGKTDRGALPEPPAPRTADEHVPARTEAERVVVDVWALLLGVEPGAISVLDDVFDLGAHSMLAARAATRIGARLGRRVPVRLVFAQPTVAGLAEAVADCPPSTGGDALVPVADRGAVPLSHAQERLWFLHRLDGPTARYNIPFALRLTGDLDLAAMRAAVADVARRHESLRTIYPDVDGVARQVVLDDVPVGPMVCEDVAEADLPARLAAMCGLRFDLTAEVPWQARLLRLGPREHVLAVVLHHVAGDAGSQAPFLRDVGLAYVARVEGREPSFAPLRVQYADYAIWQRKHVAAEHDRDLAFWRAQLAELPPALRLPLDRKRTALAQPSAAIARHAPDRGLGTRIAALARRYQVTPFMVVHAAVAALLTRHGAGTDIPVGTQVDARGPQALEDMIGLFLNALVLRTSTAGDPTFGALLGRVRAAGLDAQEHAALPFEQLVEELNPPRSPGLHPLYQVSLAYRVERAPELSLPGLVAAEEPVDVVAARFDLAFVCTDRPDGLELELVYATELVDPATATALVDRLVRLLGHAVDAPELPISRLDLLSEGERHALTAWGTGAPAGRQECLADLVERTAARHPDAVAVEHETGRLTYRELDAAANRLAHVLLARGARPETTVGVAMARSAELVVAVLAVLKTGAAYLPLDPSHPADRVRYIVDDAGPLLTVADQSTVDKLPASAGAVAIEDLPTAEAPSCAPARRVTPANLAYVVYTSGSTGRPKGVLVSHSGVAALVRTATGRAGVTRHSKVAQFASIGFDVAFWELCMALAIGATLVVVPERRRVAGRPLTDYLAEHDVTTVALPPSLLAALPADCVLPDGATVLTGSETVPPEVITRFGAACTVLNAYGPTEATVNSTLWVAPPGWSGRSVPIGVPDPGSRLHVLDEALRVLPPGAAGELGIAGPGLARGYLGMPGATAAAFRPDPHGPPGSRLYRTGDLVRWRADGTLEFLGRADDQVQIRGFRVEPAEAEAALLGLDGVREAVVVADTEHATARLVGYVVADGQPGPTEPALRAALAEGLPHYLVPEVLVVLDAIPKTAGGKVDRARLPAPVHAPRRISDPPVTALETTVADAVCEVLGIAAVGLSDDLFQLGGHSLQLPRIVAALLDRTGVEIALRDVFGDPTVAGIVAAVRRGSATPAAAIKPVDRETRRRSVLPAAEGGIR